jgi:hypothetical protein
MPPPKAPPPISNQTPKQGQPPKPSQSKAKDDDSDTFSFLDELNKAFNRGGVTHFFDEYEPEPYLTGDGVVKNSQRRSEKLKESYREAIDNEPSPEDRRQETERLLFEGPNEEVRVALHEWYRGKCQICGETWPERNGSPYFTAAYLVERRHARWVDSPGNAICLCAEHFAQWRHAAKETPDVGVVDQIQGLRLAAEAGNGNLGVRFRMLEGEHTITYDKKHLLALRALLESASEAGR